MTVNSPGEVRIEFAGNGTSTVFPFPYQFFQQDDLEVWVTQGDPTSSAARQVLNVDYNVFGEMNPSGGTVTMHSAPKVDQTLVVINHPDIVQFTHYVNADDFPADSHEQALDRLTKICQWMSDRLDRTIHFPDYLPTDEIPPTGTGPEGFEFVEEAPTDNFTYGRRNQEWIHVTSEAASDGYTYGRVNGHWEKVLLLDGGTLTGGLVLDKDSPLVDREAASKFYVDQVGKRVDLITSFPEAPSDSEPYARINGHWERTILKDGGTMTGGLILDKDSPLAPREAASKFYVDELSKRVDLIGSISEAPSDGEPYAESNAHWEKTILKDGGTMTGPLVLNTLTPLSDSHAAPKKYVDNVDKRVDIVFSDFARLDSPGFIGNPTTPTPPANDADLTIANTSFVRTAISTYGMSDSLADGAVYGRRNNAWTKAVNLAGDQMSGPLILSGDPGANINQAATKHYVDSTIASGGTFVDAPSDGKVYGRLNGAWQRGVNAAGDTLTGPLIAAADPSVPLGVATKQYVDAKPATDPTKVLKAGDTMSGALSFNMANPIIQLNKTAAAQNNIVYGLLNALGRWAIIPGDSAAETGSNVGSDFSIQRYNDAGAFVASAFTIQRSTGATYVGAGLTINGAINFNGDAGLQSSTSGIVFGSGGGGFTFRPYGTGNNTNSVQVFPSGIIQLNGSSAYYGTANGVNGGLGTKLGTNNTASGNYFNIWHEGSNGLQYLCINNTQMGTIAYNSDYRIKKDVAPLPGMWETVKALKPISYTHQEFTPPSELERSKDAQQPFITGDDKERWGFIAHEVQETTVDTASAAAKDAPDAIQDLNLAPVVAALTKALQEAMARIEALEAAV